MLRSTTMVDDRPPPTRADDIYQRHLGRVHLVADGWFVRLMVAQWLLGLGLALLSPHVWAGTSASLYLRVVSAAGLGGLLSGAVLVVARLRPGRPIARYTVAAAQMLWSALLIHLSNGRIETHFHVFGSLACLASYRDWRVLAIAVAVLVGEHGITSPTWWVFSEHLVWVTFTALVLVMATRAIQREMRVLAAHQAGLESVTATIEHELGVRTVGLHGSREQFRQLLETVQVTPFEMSRGTWEVTYVGPQGPRLLGCPGPAWLEPGFWDARVHGDDRAALYAHFQHTTTGAGRHEVEVRLRGDHGRWVWVQSIVGAGDPDAVVRGVLIDVTDRRLRELELAQAQRLESVGRLAAGIAHEINTPLQYVGDSVQFLRDAFADTLTVVHAHQQLRDACAAGTAIDEPMRRVAAAEDAVDLAYLVDNVPPALVRCTVGLERVAILVRSMKAFADIDHVEKTTTDLNQALTTTLTIARSEYQHLADVVLELGDLPAVDFHVGEINQVFHSLVTNAAHAIGEAAADRIGRGTITIGTRVVAEHVEISIADNGRGIPEGLRLQIFQPFFTTKPVGQGTGQGLAIAHSIVVDKHGGTLDVSSELGAGTTFRIRLPIAGTVRRAASA